MLHARLVGVVAVGACLAVAACGGGPYRSASDPTVPPDAVIDLVFPHQSWADWVTFSQQISVVTVTHEEMLPPVGNAGERGGGYVGRRLAGVVEETLWVAPAFDEIRDEITWEDMGWYRSDGELRPAPGQHAVGKRYLIPFTTYKDGQLAPLIADPIPVDGERVSDDIPSYYDFTEGLEGDTLDNVEERLATTPPHEGAQGHMDLEPLMRLREVRTHYPPGATPTGPTTIVPYY